MVYLIFISIYISIVFLMHALVYLVAARVFLIEVSVWYGWLFLLTISYVLASRFVRWFENMVVDVFYYLAACWLGVIFILFSGTVTYEIVRVFIGDDNIWLYSFLLGGFFLSAVYALINGRKLIVKKIELPIDSLEKPVRIVHLSDIHIGTVNQEKFLKRVVDLTNQKNPDIVLMTGDLFDGSIQIKPEMLTYLDALTAPTYFSTGNHEEYEGLDLVKETISNLKMRLLDSETVIEQGIQIIGVNDRQSIPREISLDAILSKLNFDTKLPTILMYHTPVEWETARKFKIDLMLSGHTHAGQIFPFNFLVRLFYKYVRDLHKKDGSYLHVTPGTGTWGPPMRLGSSNQITVMDLI